MRNRIVSLLLVLFMVLGSFAKTNFIYAEDDEEEYSEEETYSEKSDYDKCIEDRDKDACKAIAASAQSSLKDIEDKIADAQSDRDKAVALAEEYANKAASLQGEVDSLKTQIEELKVRIEELEVQITENEAKVEEINTRVKNRMVETQKIMHFNGYIEFILGSKSFSDMLSRVYGVEAIVSKDKSDRETLMDIIEQLTKDKAELDASKQQLDVSYNDIVAKQAELIAMEEFYRQEESRIQDELDEMTAERDEVYQSFADLRDALKDTGVTVNSSFTAPVHNSWISATVWNYDNNFLSGAWHLGVDYAASRGTQIHAPAGGVIIRAAGGCNDPGSLSSYCGEWIAGGGNQVYLMCEVDGTVYGFIFFHLQYVNVSYGDYVLQDEVIGTVGSSGKSTGPHCHIEMYRLGRGYLLDYLAMGWNATFSVGRGLTAYNNRCDVSSAPCILNPEMYLPN
ncbi:MAG: peptidoglycan DD-metalloendopeptidase family protein [Erysipelotrichaceae bacterium]|nr:peptidoglycan DD-metalloendopeptidase family protein [Erysipelotrichaceae bacterium]